MKFELKHGDNILTLKQYPDNHFDSIVTDPPYGIDFLGKDWDANTGALETYQECLRVLKPGGHLLAFSAARTYHHLAVTVEQAGFEIRDQIMWIYGSGFPKAQDIGKAIDKRNGMKLEKVSFSVDEMTKVEDFIYTHNETNKKYRRLPDINGGKAHAGTGYKNNLYEEVYEKNNEWSGWKTALKPAHEPIVVARKPFKGSCIDNVLEWGTGALNIDECRIESENLTYPANGINRLEFNQPDPNKWQGETITNDQGRFPSNVIGEIADYQKYFYCPKVSRKERHIGFDGNIPAPFGDVKGAYVDGERMAKVADDTQYASAENNHPTVKPVALMRYLIQLVTPPGGRVLDPFNGSGSTGMAAVELGMEYTGCDLDADYIAISDRRIRAWYEHTRPTDTFGDIFEE